MNYLLDTSIALLAIRKREFRETLLKNYINQNKPLISAKYSKIFCCVGVTC